MKLLALDIETAPALVYTFSLFKPVIGINQIVEPGRILCFSAQWRGEKKVMFYSEHKHGQEDMLAKLHELLDEADVILHQNGERFDIPWIKGELMLAGFQPPSPFQQIDLLRFMRSNTRLLSKKLDYLAQRFLNESKVTHTGFQLWIDCLNGDEKAWKLMEKYAVKDTKLLLPLYEKIKGWIPNHPNVALIEGEQLSCTRCNSKNYQRRGYRHTNASTYRQFQCKDCGGWFRAAHRVATNVVRN